MTGICSSLLEEHGYHGTAEGDLLFSIENITGSAYNDDLVGNDNANLLFGAFGNDWLEGNGGADILNGSWGEDTAAYSDSPAGVSICLLWHSASGGDAEGDQLISIEDLHGSNFDDSLFGDDYANELSGGGGNDVLLGFGGNDLLYGSMGNDTLNGGPGHDLIEGYLGADTMIGGADADTFQFATIYDSAGSDPSGIDYPNTDVILDFNPAEDKIDIRFDANALAPGYQDFTFIGDYNAFGGFSHMGQVAYFSDGTDTYLIFNTDTVYTDFEMAIRLAGQYTPDASWFV
jgi:Ca2+-binding RTX toxin-like protein